MQLKFEQNFICNLEFIFVSYKDAGFTRPVATVVILGNCPHNICDPQIVLDVSNDKCAAWAIHCVVEFCTPNKSLHPVAIGVARGGRRGHALPPQIFGMYSNFVFWEAFFPNKIMLFT